MSNHMLQKQEKLYLIFFFAMGIARNDAFHLPRMLSLFLMAIGGISWTLKMVLDKDTFWERVWQLLLLCVGIVSAYYNHHLGQLLAVMVVIGLKEVNIRSVLEAVLCIHMAILMVNGICFFMSLIDSGGVNGYYESRRILGIWDVSEQYRMYFGNLHPNETQKTICIFSALWVYLNNSEKKMLHITVFTLLNLAFYLFTLSNTGMMLWLLFAVLMILSKAQHRWMEYAGKVSPVLLLVMIMGIVGISYLYSPDNTFLRFINTCVTGRIKWAHANLDATGLSVWGKSLNASVGYESLDCGYINMLLCYGMVLFLVYCAGVAVLMRKLDYRTKYREMILVWLFQLFFIVESFVFVVWSNVTFIFMGIVLYEIQGGTQSNYHLFKKLPEGKDV